MQEHGIKGHLNIYTKDEDSVITSFGKHNRVVCFLPKSNTFYARVDRFNEIIDPTIEQILQVAKKDQGISGKWELLERIESHDRKSIDYTFIRC